MSYLELYQQIESELNESEKPQDEICDHPSTTEYDDYIVCDYCSQIIQDCYQENMITYNTIQMNKYPAPLKSVYKLIPFDKLSHSTSLLVEKLYNHILKTCNPKRKHKESIMLACINIAAVINNEVFIIDNPKQMLSYVYLKIKDKYNVNYRHIVQSMILNKIMIDSGMTFPLDKIQNLIDIIHMKSNLFFTSRYRSILCAIIYFWITLNIPFEMSVFCNKMKISLPTLIKKYTDVKEVILTVEMKSIIKNLLLNCKPIQTSSIKSDFSNALMDYKHKLYIEDFDNNLKVRNSKFQYLPIESRVDFRDWNYILDTKYYNHLGHEYILLIHDFKFDEYNLHNDTNGNDIINLILSKYL